MKKVLLVFAMTGFLFTASAQADIDFGTYKDGSTLTWQTLIHEHRDHPGVFTEFTVLDALSAKMRGVYGSGDAGDSAMYTALTLSAGDTVTFDWSLSNNGNNIPDYNGGTYLGDATFQFRTVVDYWSFPIATERFIAGNDHQTYDNGEASYDNQADLNTGLHVEFLLGENDYTLNITSIANPLVSSTTTLPYADGGTVGDIQSFRVGLWDSEQDVTVSNFTVVPEPATLCLLGLGGLAALRRKRRR